MSIFPEKVFFEVKKMKNSVFRVQKLVESTSPWDDWIRRQKLHKKSCLNQKMPIFPEKVFFRVKKMKNRVFRGQKLRSQKIDVFFRVEHKISEKWNGLQIFLKCVFQGQKRVWKFRVQNH